MTSFSIQCTTCQARLRARDASVIGQILSCPKCGSMVLVEAPPGYEVAPPPVAAAAESSPARHDSRADTKPMHFPEDGTDFPDPDAITGGAPHSDGDLDAQREANASDDADGEPLAPADWTSAESQKMRRLLMLSALGVGAVVLLVALFGFFRAGRATADSDRAGTGAGTDQAPPTRPTGAEANPPTPNGGGDAVTLGGPPSPGGPKPPEAGRPAAGGPKTGGSKEPKTGGSKEPKTGGSKEPKAGGAASGDPKAAGDKPPQTPTGTAAAAGSGTPKKPEAPPGFKPDEEGAKADAKELTSSLRQLERLLNPGAAPELSGGPASPPVKRTPEDRPPVEFFPRPKQRKVDLKVQLGHRIAAVQFENVPLIEFVRFLSEMSTIPITLDPDALDAAGIRPDAPVSAKRDNVRVGELLTGVVGPLKLGLLPGDSHLLITFPDADKRAEHELEVDDLVSGRAELPTLVEWVRRCVEPTGWESAGGKATLAVRGGSLVANATPAVAHKARRFLDRLRRTRKLKPRYGLPESCLRIAPPRVPDKLQQPITANFRISAYFTEVLEHLTAESGVQMLVDWQALGEVGWNPNGKVRLSVADTPVEKALMEVLRRMGLNYRVLDDQTVQISTTEALTRGPQVEFYDVADIVPDLAGGENLIGLLKATFGEAAFKDPSGGGAAFYDPVSKRLIVAVPLHVHPAVERLLNQVRRK